MGSQDHINKKYCRQEMIQLYSILSASYMMNILSALDACKLCRMQKVSHQRDPREQKDLGNPEGPLGSLLDYQVMTNLEGGEKQG